MKFSRLTLAAIAAVLPGVPAVAQTAPAAQTIVVTGARVPQPAELSPLDLRVIDRAAIERLGAPDLPTLLQRLAGIEISATGGAGQPAGLFLRGANAGHVLLLVDGVRVGSATTGTSAFEHLALAQIERIEVLQGPASGLYGADAIGGVVQVFTRRPQGLALAAEAGSEATRGVAVTWGSGPGATRASASLSWRSVDAGSATNADNAFSYNPDRDSSRNLAASGRLEHDWAAGHTLSLQASRTEARTHFDAGAGSDDVNRQRLSTLAVQSRDRYAAGWNGTLRLARSTDALQVAGAFPGRFRTDSDQLSWQNELQALGGTAVAGAEWRRERVDSDTAYTETTRRVGSLFAGWTGAPVAGQQLQLALRHDDDSQFGAHATGHLGWLLNLAPGWQLSAAAGTAFKAPSFNDLYYPLQFGYSGNPDLDPERSRSVEAGLRWATGPWQARATVFDNRIRGLIVINDSFSSVDNLARARNRGLSLQARWAQGPWTARAEATWQSPENDDTGAQLVRRAKRFGSAGLDWAAGALSAGADLVAVGARYHDGANTDRLAGYALLHLRAGWRPAPEWRLDLRLDNAADRAYTLVRGYEQPGRRLFLTLAWNPR
ncbi:MAG: TonB-dependent vitamin B12 receptor [Rubrivivax sp.]